MPRGDKSAYSDKQKRQAERPLPGRAAASAISANTPGSVIGIGRRLRARKEGAEKFFYSTQRAHIHMCGRAKICVASTDTYEFIAILQDPAVSLFD